jgi:hypothetical protein
MVDPFDAEFLLGLPDGIPQVDGRILAEQKIHVDIILEIFSIRERHEFVGQDVPVTIHLDALDVRMRFKRGKRIFREFHLHGPLVKIVQQKQPAVVFALMLNIDNVWSRSKEPKDGLQTDLLLGKEVEVLRVPMLKIERRQRRSTGQVKVLAERGVPKAQQEGFLFLRQNGIVGDRVQG